MSSSPNLGVVGVKVVLGTEMRRLNLPSGGDKLAHVASNISRMFPQVQDFKLFYTDDEQDQIRVANDDDLHEALQCQQGGRVLKLTVVPSNEVVQLLASDEAIANVNTSASSSPHHHQADTFTYNQQGQVLHVQVMCDGCGLKPIAGSRFKCVVCPDFDLCEACEAKNIHPPSHIMLKMRLPAPNVKIVSPSTSRRQPRQQTSTEPSIPQPSETQAVHSPLQPVYPIL